MESGAFLAHNPRQKESSSVISLDSIDDARFVPGLILAGRYRIVGLLGRGGMGEVYRADDLKLGQPVALKFLSKYLASDNHALARLYREVRIARQVSHPNVCRVYDIGELEGEQFLAMEFIKGEELSSLLHRIGRLPEDKATEIARQICAGLAAAHNRGVLHRDLKPSNVMIDEHGNARLTDFGIAALAVEARGDESRSGTPAYMSPEQLAGKELTVKSDIYSLGLVLYELFTGKKAFDAPTLAQLFSLRNSDVTPTSPSSFVQNLDPLIERVILLCIEKDPDGRPASALQVAAALPGGDPLAAALAAGETPSPEAVAAAPTKGLLSPALTITCFVAVFVLLTLRVLFFGETNLLNFVTTEKSGEVLAERAREINSRLGYTSRPVDTAQGFYRSRALEYIGTQPASPAHWEMLKGGEVPILLFWYRMSPRDLLGIDRFAVSDWNPPVDVSGMTNTSVDLQGRLRYFIAVPQQLDDSQFQGQPDWSILFAEAGFDMSKFREAVSRWTPPYNSDARTAWDGELSGPLKIPIHIEAAAFHGKPVYFAILYPWNRPDRQEERQPPQIKKIKIWLAVGLVIATVLGAALLALRNVRLGLSDRQGAFRLALYIFVIGLVRGMLVAHHVPNLGAEFTILQTHLAWALLWTITTWVFYLAIEPFVRRRWPQRIISWKRLISGEIRDALVGRDILIGVLLGVALDLTLECRILLPRLFGWTPPIVSRFAPQSLSGVRAQLSHVLGAAELSPFVALLALLVLLLFSIFLRRDWLTAIIGWVLATAIIPILPGDNPAIVLFLTGLFSAIFIFTLMRFGLLTAAFSFWTWSLLFTLPLTANFSAWFASATFLVLTILVGVAFFGFYNSLAGRPVFKGLLTE
jgi:serine/threonine-protein kinase